MSIKPFQAFGIVSVKNPTIRPNSAEEIADVLPNLLPGVISLPAEIHQAVPSVGNGFSEKADDPVPDSAEKVPDTLPDTLPGVISLPEKVNNAVPCVRYGNGKEIHNRVPNSGKRAADGVPEVNPKTPGTPRSCSINK